MIAGADQRDATSTAGTRSEIGVSLPGDEQRARIGVPRRILAHGVDSEVLGAFEEALDVLVQQGATIVNIELPHMAYAIPIYYLVAPAEASSNLARYDGVRYGFRSGLRNGSATVANMYDRTRDEGFGAEVKRRIMLGTYALSSGYYDAYYVKAQRVRSLVRRDYDRAFEQADVIAMPTSPTAAFPIGEHTDDPLAMYLRDIFTVSANLTGLPAISLPAGFTKSRLPIGFQLMGRAFDEATLFRVAGTYEREAPWWKERPPALVAD